MRISRLTVLLSIPWFLPGQALVPAAPPAADATAATAHGAIPAPLTAKQKFKLSASRMMGPINLVGIAAGAGIGQWRDSPPEWHQGAEGYAKRFADGLGFVAAHDSIALGFDLAYHVDPRYRRKPEASVNSRVWNAIHQTLLANTDSGETMINVPEIAGDLGAGFLSNTWQPADDRSPGDALTRGLLAIGFRAVSNTAREFLPDVLSHLKHRQPAPAGTSSPVPSR